MNEEKLELFLNGVKINLGKKDQIYRIYDEKARFVGTGEVKLGKLKRDVVI